MAKHTKTKTKTINTYMGIINHFSQGNNDQEYEGLHSRWKDKVDKHFDAVENLIEANNKASDLHREASNKAYYNLAIDHAINTILTMSLWTELGEETYKDLIKNLTNLKKD